MAALRLRFLDRRLVLAGALSVVFATFASDPGSAQTCPTTPALSSGVSVTATADPAVYSITPGLARWSAVGVRAADAMNWNIEARDATAPYPTCFSGVLANSSSTGIDFLVTDWRFRPAGTDYIGAGTASQTGTSARVQYEQIFFDYPANDPFDQLFYGANDVLKVRETNLQAGVRYFFEVWPSAGFSGLKFYLFAPVTSGSGWVPRSGRVLEQALVDGSGQVIEYTPSVSGYFGIVITNESALAGNAYITVKRCPFSSSPLTDNLPRVTVKLDDWPAFVPPASTWGAIGVRGEPGYSYNWDVAPGLRLQNGSPMTCTDSVLVSQFSGVGVRVIAGDFRAAPLRLYTAHANLEGQPKTSSQGYMEWEDGQDSIVVNAPPTVVSPPAHNVLDAWSIRLIQGGTYNFQLVADGGATASYQILLFANPSPGAQYWRVRPDAVLQISSSGVYTPSATGLYGLVVVNDNGGTGGYSLSVMSDLIGVELGSEGASASRIRTVSPNPSFAGARIDYDLAHAGKASLRVTDVAGRHVARLAVGARTAGPASILWDGRADDGTRPPNGVYFVTLYLDGQAQGRTKMLVLR